MAFYNKVGNVLRQSISAGNSLSGQSSIFNAVRCMSTKLFIGGLSYTTDEQSLREAFSSFGEVEFVRVVTDRETGRSKGFGFVNYHTDEDANAALSAMDGKELNGRNIRVSHAQERASRANFSSGGGGYGGGGYRGGGYGN